jgi:hypothetical protein
LTLKKINKRDKCPRKTSSTKNPTSKQNPGRKWIDAKGKKKKRLEKFTLADGQKLKNKTNKKTQLQGSGCLIDGVLQLAQLFNLKFPGKNKYKQVSLLSARNW